jgi:hypothetical protein
MPTMVNATTTQTNTPRIRIVVSIGVIIIVALCFMLLLPLRITTDGSVHDCGAPLSVLTDSGSARATANEKKCEHHATLRLRDLGIVAAIAALGGLGIIVLWPGDEDEGTQRARRPPLTRRFP